MLHLAVAALALLPAARACAGHDSFERRAVNAARPASAFTNLNKRGTVDRTTEAGEARIKDAAEECTYYNFPAATTLMPSYPTIWATADLSGSGIPQSDKDLFYSLNSSIPSISPRGTRAGDFSGVTYDGDTDPDCWWSWNKCTTPKIKTLPKDVTRCAEPNTWGFTLDDGPNCSHNAYFDYLQSIEQKATLFYIGSNVLDWPLEAQRGLSDGHEICSHTWSHPYMTSMTNEQAFAELYYSKKAIKDILGITVRCWRPPYGDVDDRIRYIAEKLDLRTIIWNEDTDDWNWSNVGVAQIDANYDAILKKQAQGKYDRSGVIVLSHEIDGMTMNISQQYLPSIRKQFTGGVMPVAVCMNNTQPYVETASYTYPNYAQYTSGTVSISLAAPTAATTISTLVIEVSSTAAASSSAAATAAVTTGNAAAASQASASASQASASAAQQNAQKAASTTSGAFASHAVPLMALITGALVGAVVVL
ncbi:hypothetical protein JCM8547_004346 [Rhodosporidiobolus lusitaniae]